MTGKNNKYSLYQNVPQFNHVDIYTNFSDNNTKDSIYSNRNKHF
jgi:hypothetical protein